MYNNASSRARDHGMWSPSHSGNLLAIHELKHYATVVTHRGNSSSTSVPMLEHENACKRSIFSRRTRVCAYTQKGEVKSAYNEKGLWTDME